LIRAAWQVCTEYNDAFMQCLTANPEFNEEFNKVLNSKARPPCFSFSVLALVSRLALCSVATFPMLCCALAVAGV
jgi:hypothetical protein